MSENKDLNTETEINVENLNEGVDYMEQNNTEEVKNEQKNKASQPIVNTEAAKAKVNDLVAKAKGGLDYYKNNIKTDKKLWAGTGVAALVLIIILLLIFTSPAKGVVKKYAQAMKNYDAEKMATLFHKDMIEERWDDSDELVDYYEDFFENKEDADYKVTGFKIDGDYKKYDEDDLEDYAEYLDEYFGINEKDVKEIRRYKIEFEVDDDGDEDTEKEKVLVAKIKGKWYLVGTE